MGQSGIDKLVTRNEEKQVGSILAIFKREQAYVQEKNVSKGKRCLTMGHNDHSLQNEGKLLSGNYVEKKVLQFC